LPEAEEDESAARLCRREDADFGAHKDAAGSKKISAAEMKILNLPLMGFSRGSFSRALF
jgi:hypothetical protein